MKICNITILEYHVCYRTVRVVTGASSHPKLDNHKVHTYCCVPAGFEHFSVVFVVTGQQNPFILSLEKKKSKAVVNNHT
jgi:hypothetical protein